MVLVSIQVRVLTVGAPCGAGGRGQQAAALQQHLQADLLVRLQTRSPSSGAGGILPLSSVLVLMAELQNQTSGSSRALSGAEWQRFHLPTRQNKRENFPWCWSPWQR